MFSAAAIVGAAAGVLSCWPRARLGRALRGRRRRGRKWKVKGGEEEDKRGRVLWFHYCKNMAKDTKGLRESE